MKGVTAALLIIVSFSASADQYIDVKFRGFLGLGNGCAESTDIRKRQGKNDPICVWDTKKQSDGYCASSGEHVIWKGNKPFEIVTETSVFSTCSGQGTKRVDCEVAGGISNGPYSYAVQSDYKDGGKCELDPRIIVNNGH